MLDIGREAPTNSEPRELSLRGGGLASNLDFGCFQDQGARKQQEDYFATTEPSLETVESHGGFLAVVADGMGGHSDGALASLTAVNTFMAEYLKKDEDETVAQALHRALLQSNQALLTVKGLGAAGDDMGTTLLAAVVQGRHLYWMSVGDSRLYRSRRKRLEVINEEHSYGAELDAKVAAGQMSVVEADSQANKRHMLTSYLGIERIPKINLSRVPLELQPGDQILLCTDGLNNTLSDADVQRCLAGEGTAHEKCEKMGLLVRGKCKPGQDNVTIVLLAAESADLPSPSSGRRWPPRFGKAGAIGLGMLLLAALVTSAYFFLWLPSQSPKPPAKPAPAQESEPARQEAPQTRVSPAPLPKVTSHTTPQPKWVSTMAEAKDRLWNEWTVRHHA